MKTNSTEWDLIAWDRPAHPLVYPMSMFNIGLNVKDAMSPFFCRFGWVPGFTSCAWPLPIFSSLPPYNAHHISHFYKILSLSLCSTHTHSQCINYTPTPTADRHLHKWIIQNTDNQSITFFHTQLNNSLIHICIYVSMCVCETGFICYGSSIYVCMHVFMKLWIQHILL